MAQKQIKRLRRELKAAGVQNLSNRVWRRLKGAHAGRDGSWDAVSELGQASHRAFLAAWGRMGEGEKAKALERMEPEARGKVLASLTEREQRRLAIP